MKILDPLVFKKWGLEKEIEEIGWKLINNNGKARLKTPKLATLFGTTCSNLCHPPHDFIDIYRLNQRRKKPDSLLLLKDNCKIKPVIYKNRIVFELKMPKIPSFTDLK